MIKKIRKEVEEATSQDLSVKSRKTISICKSNLF